MDIQKYVDRLLGFKSKETARANELAAELEIQKGAIADLKTANDQKDGIISELLVENATLKGTNADQQAVIDRQQAAIAMFDAAFDQVETSQAAVAEIDNTPVQTAIVEAVIEDAAIETPATVAAAPECAPSEIPAPEVVEAAIAAIATADAGE